MSTLNVSNITDGTDTVETSYVLNGSAKAWVNFDGTGTIAIRDSLNKSSLTDNSIGDYTSTFTNSMANASYCLSLGHRGNRPADGDDGLTRHLSGSCGYSSKSGNLNSSGEDNNRVQGSVFGDLA